jgi:hypothetical protein
MRPCAITPASRAGGQNLPDARAKNEFHIHGRCELIAAERNLELPGLYLQRAKSSVIHPGIAEPGLPVIEFELELVLVMPKKAALNASTAAPHLGFILEVEPLLIHTPYIGLNLEPEIQLELVRIPDLRSAVPSELPSLLTGGAPLLLRSSGFLCGGRPFLRLVRAQPKAKRERAA